MPVHVLFIPDWKPTSLNVLAGGHWTQRRKLKRADADVIAAYAFDQDIPRALGPRRVSVAVEVAGRGRLMDPDNALKGLLDSCVHAGLLLDDSGSLCVLGSITVRRGERTRTVITLEDIEG